MAHRQEQLTSKKAWKWREVELLGVQVMYSRLSDDQKEKPETYKK